MRGTQSVWSWLGTKQMLAHSIVRGGAGGGLGGGGGRGGRGGLGGGGYLHRQGGQYPISGEGEKEGEGDGDSDEPGGNGGRRGAGG